MLGGGRGKSGFMEVEKIGFVVVEVFGRRREVRVRMIMGL